MQIPWLRLVCSVLVWGALLPAAARVAALEAVGTVRRVDAEQRVLLIFAGGQERRLPVAADARVLAADGQPLADGLTAAALGADTEVTITVDRSPTGAVVQTIRLGRHPTAVPGTPGGAAGPGAGMGGKPSVGLTPLDEMGADARYQGEDGGLYGGGANEPPPEHLAAARSQTARIVPLDADGKPAPAGRIGLVSISMSNATQEFSSFKRIADADPRKAPAVAIVDCAQGGQAMAEWVNPEAPAWREADRRLQQAQVSPRQVQVVWVKLANKGPRGDLAEHGRKLQQDTQAVLQNAQARFPNLRIAYLGSRIYAGYSLGPLNPEPYAYESAFVVRWLIQAQIKGEPALRYDDAAAPAKVPLLLWGPYFWADGTTPRRSDGLVWERQDLGGDGVHPSDSGRRKVAEMLLRFFTQDPLARTWFVGKAE